MGKHEENDVNSPTFYFTYNELYNICKKLDSESCKFKNLISFSRYTIYFLEKDNKNL